MNIFISFFNFCTNGFKRSGGPSEQVQPLHEKNQAEKAAARAEDRADEISAKVAQMEGRIDPLVEFLNSITPPSERGRLRR